MGLGVSSDGVFLGLKRRACKSDLYRLVVYYVSNQTTRQTYWTFCNNNNNNINILWVLLVLLLNKVRALDV